MTPKATHLAIVFLDIDGVLNSDAYLKRIGTTAEEVNDQFDALGEQSSGPESYPLREKSLDPLAIQHLNSLLQETGAKVVLSTNWARKIPVQHIVALLECRGFEGEVFGRTPRKMSLYSKGGEIALWLDQNRTHSFVILEDEHMDRYQNRTVHIDWREGLTAEHVQKAKEILLSQQRNKLGLLARKIAIGEATQREKEEARSMGLGEEGQELQVFLNGFQDSLEALDDIAKEVKTSLRRRGRSNELSGDFDG